MRRRARIPTEPNIRANSTSIHSFNVGIGTLLRMMPAETQLITDGRLGLPAMCNYALKSLATMRI